MAGFIIELLRVRMHATRARLCLRTTAPSRATHSRHPPSNAHALSAMGALVSGVLQESGLPLNLGIVQTAYANGASTIYMSALAARRRRCVSSVGEGRC